MMTTCVQRIDWCFRRVCLVSAGKNTVQELRMFWCVLVDAIAKFRVCQVLGIIVFMSNFTASGLFIAVDHSLFEWLSFPMFDHLCARWEWHKLIGFWLFRWRLFVIAGKSMFDFITSSFLLASCQRLSMMTVVRHMVHKLQSLREVLKVLLVCVSTAMA